ncbi:hypothetical protein LL184_0194 [Lactococcus lactis subsp. lactis]|nr:hypothetical protein LL184_0194 [Lactococcus lactis subsp. lactis]
MTNERTGELGQVSSHSLDVREDLIQRYLYFY